MILSAQTIRERQILEPTRTKYKDSVGNSAGLGPASYDLTLAESLELKPGGFKLASAAEKFYMPHDVCATVHDKSSLARRGVAVQNTFIDPGWRGCLTLEISNHGVEKIFLPHGSAIAQVVFQQLDRPTDIPYEGKYQDQKAGPQEAR